MDPVVKVRAHAAILDGIWQTWPCNVKGHQTIRPLVSGGSDLPVAFACMGNCKSRRLWQIEVVEGSEREEPWHAPAQARVAQLCRAKADTGKRLTAELRRMRAYKNPDFLQKMVLYHGVDDRGTNFAPDVFDPRAIPKEDYYQACVSHLTSCSVV